MAYTGVLEKDATREQILAAKKTVQIVTEINGQKYIESFDGTKGLAVLVDTGAYTEGEMTAGAQSLLNFIDTLLDKIPKELCGMILAQRLSGGKHE